MIGSILSADSVKLNTLPFVPRAFNANIPAHQIRQASANCQAQARPFVISRQTGFNLPERLKQGLEIIRLDPYPCVGTRQSDGRLSERFCRGDLKSVTSSVFRADLHRYR